MFDIDFEDIFDYFRCKFGLHDWSRWSEPVHNRYTDTGTSYYIQTRTCKKCNKFGITTKKL
jgi:hypothetical protein